MLHTFKDEENGDYGYRDGYRIVIPAAYDEAEPFRAGLAVVRKGDFYGVIDESGNSVVPFEFGSIFISHDGWIQADIKKKYSLFDNKGQLVLEADDIIYWYHPEDGIIRAKKDTGWGCMDLRGNILVPFEHIALGPITRQRMSFYDEGKWGWLGTSGDVLVEPVFGEVGTWDKDRWWGRKNGVYRLYDFNDRLFLDEGWTKIQEPINGTAIVKVQGAWKYIDQSFHTILQLPPCYDRVRHFYEELAAVKQEGVWGFIDTAGREVIRPRWDKVEDFSERLAAVRHSGKWGYINTSGDLVIDYHYWSAGHFINGRARVIDGWYEWYINPQNEAVTEPVYLDY